MISSSDAISPYEFDREQFLEIVVSLANSAWTEFNTNSHEWRLQYYGSLYDTGEAHKLLRILRVEDDWAKIVEYAGFTVVLPILEQLVELHIQGRLDQYSFQTNWLDWSTRDGKSFHYIQSVYVTEKYVQSNAIKRALTEGIRELMVQQHCGYGGKPFLLYAEIGSPEGDTLCKRYGFELSPKLSLHENPIRVFDSEVSNDAVKEHTIGRVQSLYDS